MRFVGSCVLATLLACGASDHGAETAGDAGSAGPAPGYVRFVTKAVTVPANTSSQWLQWVQAPMDHDVDIADIQGSQSAGGHHAVLYSTSDVEPVGTLKTWMDADITTSHFLGGIGGEGGSALRLPAGAVFRLKAGQALALQAHYLNASAQPLQGTTQLDVKFADPSPSDRLVSLLTNTALTFNVPAQAQGHVDISCTLTQDASILMFTNHMHQWGTSALTQLVDAAGTTSVLKSDPVWNSEWTTNPNFTKETIAAPLALTKGETLKTSCDWTNTTAQALSFPTEMCVFIGFYLGDSDIGCIDNGALGTD